VLPLAACRIAAAAVDLVPVAAVDVVHLVVVEIVLVVDRDVSAAVPITISPAAAPGRAQRNPGAESERAVIRRRVIGIWISRRAIDIARSVLRNVDNLGIGRLNYDHWRAIHHFGLDCLLSARL
jgi:hypothetical protein